MESFLAEGGLIIKAFAITLVLLVIRAVCDFFNFDVLSLTNLVTAFISGAIFTIAIVLAGVLTDYKESMKRSPDFFICTRELRVVARPGDRQAMAFCPGRPGRRAHSRGSPRSTG